MKHATMAHGRKTLDGWKKLMAGLVLIAAGVFYVTHSHAAVATLTGQALSTRLQAR